MRRTIEQLRNDFALYIEEIERCENAKCYWALLHVLLALPDVCATLETDPASRKSGSVGDRYVDWCAAYLPKSPTVSGADRYQMRNALLHSGSTTAQNLGTKHHTSYVHFSYVDPETFDVSVHDTTNQSRKVLNVHVAAMATETKQALESWFSALQCDPIKMSGVEQNIGLLTRLQQKRIRVTESNGSQIEKEGLTRSST
ncbi:MAG: hypothetical protein H8D67_03070 [Deltaproteobacteria bacterium]|nr:hypothetical protein [Deltaproteobacteria bacterium]